MKYNSYSKYRSILVRSKNTPFERFKKLIISSISKIKVSHGSPLVLSPDDAIHTFLNSDLDILLFDGIMAVIRD